MSEYVPDDDWAGDNETPRPTHLTRTIWRYMSLSRFLWMLQNKMLWLARADTLNDPWELALAGDQLDHVIMRRPIRPLGSTKPEEPIMDRARRVNKLWRETTFISCWSSLEHESYALWRLFCGPNEGVAISTPWRTLGKALGNVKLYVVTYCEPGSEIKTPTALELATKKRLMFEYEREVRAIATIDTNDPALIKGELGFQYPIEPEEIIRSIAVHPEAGPDLIETVVRAVMDYAPKLRDKVAWSAMREPPPLLKNRSVN
jgi:hypothetical protein